MELEWLNHKNEPVRGRIDSHVMEFVQLIGLDKTALLLLKCGGTAISFPAGSEGWGMGVSILGQKDATRVGRHFVGRVSRIPVANAFLARYFRSQGQSVSQIARRIRRTDVTVRGYLKPDDFRAEQSRQGNLAKVRA